MRCPNGAAAPLELQTKIELEDNMLRNWMARLACLVGAHRWVQHTHYRYILNDSGLHAYQCERCDK
ncbi:hypothetical protein, partial [Burkholderia cenocepacia]